MSLQEVKQYEGAGAHLNDHYSLDEYIKRRHCFLGKHPDYHHLRQLLPGIRRDANEVFGTSHPEALSVQEIRRRELQHEVEPLLPLPTTTNTDTIDSFRTYPEEEWAQDATQQTANRSTSRSRAQVNENMPPPYPPAGPHMQAQLPLNPPSPNGLRKVLEALKAPRGHRPPPPAEVSTRVSKRKAEADDHVESHSDIVATDQAPPSPPARKRSKTKPRIDRIAAGELLPANLDEARHGSELRKTQLLSALPSRKRHPDLGPEFFNPKNFTKGEKEGEGPIRCICGDNTANADHWIGCDGEGCGVWQHVRCLGEAVPGSEEERRNMRYLCQVCDPFVHRRKIREIRRANPV